MRHALILTALLTLGAGCAAAEPAPVKSATLVSASPAPALYQLTVTNPGTRSQGVRGVLLDANGKPLAEPDDLFGNSTEPPPVETPVGHFEWVRCAALWSVCGYQRIQPGEAKSAIDNQPSIGGMTEFRIVRGPGANLPVYRGEIYNAGKLVQPSGDSVETPIGKLVRFDGKLLGQQWQGWIPAAWLAREHVYYEETLWGAGSKSQHMEGTFFDEQGRPANQVSFEVVNTPIGPFVSVAGTYLWEDRGMFHQRGMQTFVPPAIGTEPIEITTFRVVEIGTAEGPAFRGELIEDDVPVNPAGDQANTALGTMVRINGAYNGHAWTGWIPASWLPPKEP